MSATNQWEQIFQLFDTAVELPPDKRENWLEQNCPNDAEIQREIKLLLSAHDRQGLLDADLPICVETGEQQSPAEIQQGRIGPYRIVEELGRGGMGMVFKARDNRLDRFVALKFLNSEFARDDRAKRRFIAEAKSASALDHPNICTVYDIGETDDGQIFIAMALCEGRTLADRISRSQLPVRDCIDIGVQIARGLACAHDAGIVHRDLKPSNVILTARGEVKIVDFGIAKLERDPAITAAGRAGTALYAAPEQLGGGMVDSRADIWSLGVVMYEMLTGVRPFNGANELEILHAVAHLEPELLRRLRKDLPAALEQAVHRALSKGPEKRFRNATEFADALTTVDAKRDLAVHSNPTTGNLPVSITTFIGRTNEVARVGALIRTARLVTLTGPAGTGKTRLTVEAAREAESSFRDGAYFVSLSAVTSVDLVLPAIAEAVGVLISGARSVTEELIGWLRDKEILLVLDNFEQVTAAAPLLLRLLEGAPGLKLLVTSRVALRLSGEHEMPVPPLEVPSSNLHKVANLKGVPAIELFVERAKAVRPEFELRDDNAAAVAEICTRLDGLPLAIELAAARIKIFSPQAIVSRLGSRLDLLKGGPRDRPPRHQTLRQALAWSYDLLDEPERRVFRRSGVFVGGFTLAAIEFVLESFGDVEQAAFDAVCVLMDQSLVSRRDGPDLEPRFHLLETIREYALECLRAAGEEQRAERAHADWFLRMAEQAEIALTGPQQASWLSNLDIEHDNLRAALAWYEEHAEIAAALRMSAGIWRFWTARGHLREGRARFERLLARAGDDIDPKLRARALNACGTLAHGASDMPAARKLLEQALAVFRMSDDRQGIALVLNNLAWIEIESSEFERAWSLATEGHELNEKIGDTRGRSVALNNLGWIANYRAEFNSARDLFSRSIALRRQYGDARGVAFGLSNLAWAEQRQGSYERALGLIKEAREILDNLSDAMLQAWACQIRAAVDYDMGRFEEALKSLSECLPIWRRVGNSSGLAFGAVYCALASLRLHDFDGTTAALDEAEPAVNSIPQHWGVALTLFIRGRLSAAQADEAAALAYYKRALALLAKVGDRRTIAECYESMAMLIGGAQPERGVRLLAAADAARRKINSPVPPCDRETLDVARQSLRESLGAERFDEVWAQGNAEADQLSREILG